MGLLRRENQITHRRWLCETCPTQDADHSQTEQRQHRRSTKTNTAYHHISEASTKIRCGRVAFSTLLPCAYAASY